MEKIIYNIKDINDEGIEETLYNLWINGKILENEGRYLRFLYEGNEHCISLEFYRGFMGKSYLELSNMVEKLRKLNPRITEIENGKLKDEFQKFINKFQIYLELAWNDETKKGIRNLLEKSSKSMLIGICLGLSEELESCKINIFDFISKDDIFDEIMKNQMYLQDTNNEGFQKVLFKFREEYGSVEQIQEKALGNFNQSKKGKLYYEKMILFLTLTSTSDEGKQKEYADTLVKIGFNEENLYCMCSNDIITLEMFSKIYNIPQLKEIALKSIKLLPLSELIIIYGLIKEDDVLKYINLRKITVEQLKKEGQKDTINSAYMAIFIKIIYDKGRMHFSKEELDEILLTSKKFPVDYARAYYKLNTTGVIKDDVKLIEAYEEQIEYLNQSSKAEMEKWEAKPVDIDEIIDYFNSERIIEMLRESIISQKTQEADKKSIKIHEEKILAFYKAIKEVQENGKISNKNLNKELISAINEGCKSEQEKILVTLELFKYGIIPAEYVSEIVNDSNSDKLLELYDNGMSDKEVLWLYFDGVISKENLYMVYEFNEEKLEEKNLRKKLENNEISQKNVEMMYLLGIISIEMLSKFVQDQLDWITVIDIVPEFDKVEKLGELYLNQLITFEDLQELKEENLISEKEATAILGRRNVIEELKRGLISEKARGKKKTKSEEEAVDVEKNIGDKIELEDRDVLLTNLGYQALRNKDDEILVVAKGSFEGYRVYLNKQYHTILFEGDGASYLTHEHQAQNFITIQEGKESKLKGTRSEWASLAIKQRNARKKGDKEAIIKAEGNKTLRRKTHTRSWGKNIIQSMVEISTIFMDGSQEEKAVYIRDTSKKIEDENKDELEYINGLFEERKTRN